MTIAAVNRGEWGAQMERADVQEWSCEGGEIMERMRRNKRVYRWWREQRDGIRSLFRSERFM